MSVWTAFIVGFIGSFHCIGMCGPIALALPGSTKTVSFLIERVLYNMGRIVTYTLFGSIVGIAGRMISLAGWQALFSIFLGSLIIFIVLMPVRWRNVFSKLPFIERLLGELKKILPEFMKKHSKGAMLTTGILNGFLPCGFVYVGLAGAASTGTVSGGMTFMALFGAGTFPAMLLVSMGPRIVSPKLRDGIRKVTPYLAVCVGLLLILRGLNL